MGERGTEQGNVESGGIRIEQGCSQAIMQISQLLFTCRRNYESERRHDCDCSI